MSRDQIVELYLQGGMSRRTFVRRMVAAGITVAAAVSYAELLRPSAAQAARGRALYYAETPTPTATPAPTAVATATATATATPGPDPTPVPATPTPTPRPAAGMDRTLPVVTLGVLTKRRDSLIKSGLYCVVSINEPGSVAVKVLDDKKRQVSRSGSGLVSRRSAGSSYLRVKLSLIGKAKARKGKLRWTVEATGTDGQGNRTVITAPFRIG